MAGEEKSVAELAAEIKAEHSRAVDAVKAIAEEALGKAKAGETLVSDLKDRADDALTKMNVLTERVADIQQKAARASGSGDEPAPSIGQQFVEAESVKQFLAAGGPRTAKADSQAKATLTSATPAAARPVGAARY